MDVMRYFALLAWLLAFLAQPAGAASSPRLQTLEQQLGSMMASMPGDHGLAALDLRSGEFVGVRADDPFPMASTVKVAIAANYLAQVDYGRRSLESKIGGRGAAQLIEAMIIHSDNRATDLVLRDLGGPKTVQAWLDQHELRGIRVDRTIGELLDDRRNLYDLRDSSTPRAMVQLLQRLDSGKLLKPASQIYLLSLMSHCITGRNRIRGLLPKETPVEHKTGTLSGFTGDVGFITLPNGRRLAVAFFERNGTDRPSTIAWAARAIYDGFEDLLRHSFVRAPVGSR